MAVRPSDVVIVGGGLGGVAAALAALDRGLSVTLTEEFAWLGGQLTSQAVPPDEHPWVERFGVTRRYARLRGQIRQYYHDHYPLTAAARATPDLNPGAGWVSRLCHEPRVAVAVIEAMLAPHRASGRLKVLRARPVRAEVDGDVVRGVWVRGVEDGADTLLEAPYYVDATETGELLPLTGCEHVTGFESARETGEPSAPDEAQPLNMQAVSVCFAMDHVDGDHTVDRPAGYDHWRAVQPDSWGGRLLSWTSPDPRTLEPVTRPFAPNPGDDVRAAGPGDGNLWTYRRILARDHLAPGAIPSDITLVNWPMTDYAEGCVFDVPDADTHLRRAAGLSLSALHWMQTEAPRHDGGMGYPGLRLRPDVMGTTDGLAQAPYIRESRRIRAERTIVEQDLALAVRGDRGSERYADSVGVGLYRIDLHPTTGGDPYLDVGVAPFLLPLGALVPRRLRNLLPANKNIGTTHLTNGCYRVHPVEWNVGEVVGHLVATCLAAGVPPTAVRNTARRFHDFRDVLHGGGVQTSWPDLRGR